jgi:hypothetical protein
MYVGETTNDYVKGYFYIASSDGAAEPTYSWVSMVDDVPTNSSKNLVTSDGVYQVTPLTRSNGSRSAIGGEGCSASGTNAFAYGANCSATANRAVAFGRTTVANSGEMMSIGRFNSPNNGDIFNIGNGSSTNARSNIVEVNSTSLNVNGAITQNGTPVLTSAGTLPVFSYDPATKTLTYAAGSLPSA